MNIRHTNRKRTIHKVIAKILLIALVFPVVTSILPMQVQAYGNNNIVPFATYYEFRDAVLGTEHDINGDYNYQCWDGAALLWHQLGKTLFTERRLYGEGFSPGAKTCWNLREVNKYEDFILIENKEDILQGDVLVFGFGQWGHICFADEDYREGMTEIRCLGQNQINSNDFPGHAFDAQTKINLNGFLGAFRYKGWHGYGNNDWMCWVESMGSNVTSAFAGKKVRLRSAESGKYVCGENNSTVHADGTCGIGEYQTYLTPDGWIGFKLEDGNWLSVQENNYIRTTATDLQSWECFKIFLYEGYYYIISQKNLCYIQVTNEQARPLRATRSNEQGLYGATWERFRIEVVYDGTEVGLGGGNEDIPSYVSCEYWGSDYNEGWYEGQWKNGRPNGFGKLIYTDFADGKYYSLNYSDGSQAIASFYEGCFVDGARVGSGKVVYDNGWWEEGTYYGTYQPGKVVFEGKLWKENKGYWPTTLTATSSTSGSYSFGPYCPVQQLSVSSNIEGRYYCVIPQDFKLMLYESVTDETAKCFEISIL